MYHFERFDPMNIRSRITTAPRDHRSAVCHVARERRGVPYENFVMAFVFVLATNVLPCGETFGFWCFRVDRQVVGGCKRYEFRRSLTLRSLYQWFTHIRSYRTIFSPLREDWILHRLWTSGTGNDSSYGSIQINSTGTPFWAYRATVHTRPNGPRWGVCRFSPTPLSLFPFALTARSEKQNQRDSDETGEEGRESYRRRGTDRLQPR